MSEHASVLLYLHLCPRQDMCGVIDNSSIVPGTPFIVAVEPVALLHVEVNANVQICSWPAGCLPSMLPTRVGPNEKVRARQTMWTLVAGRSSCWTAHI